MITLPNIVIKPNTWTNLYRLAGAITGEQTLPGVAAINLQVLDGNGLLVCVTADEPTVHHGYRIVQALEIYENESTDPGLWVYAQDEEITINLYPVNVAVTGFYIFPYANTAPVINGQCRIGSQISFTAADFDLDDTTTVASVLYVDGVEQAIDYVLTNNDFGKEVYVKQTATLVGANSTGTYTAEATSNVCKVLKALS